MDVATDASEQGWRGRVTIAAVLFDVGGPLDCEVAHERRVDAAILAACADHGVPVTPLQYEEACAWAVASYAPDAYAAIVWRLCASDAALAQRVQTAFRERAGGESLFEPRPGMREILAWLHAAGLKLGLAANQPRSALPVLDQHGMGEFFHHREVSGTHGFRKPDVRVFLRACEDLAVEPRHCVMIGDRIDNDIAPARVLGMRTIRFRSGRHAAQAPRCAAEVPDCEVTDAAELRAALERLGAGVICR